MQQQELIPHLFRTEFGKICAVLARYFGIDHLKSAEDIASETFLAALETWSYQGIPENPTAWLYRVAKNKAKNFIQRNNIFSQKVAPQIDTISMMEDPVSIDLGPQNISDSQLQMLFTICHPTIPEESQIGLALRILCGFGIDEIANAFLTNKETINKRLFRAREKLRQQKVTIELPTSAEIDERLKTVLKTLYLLFNEGYYSESNNAILREELCLEAMRLTYLLINYKPTDQPAVNALLALMCFHASRFPARKDNNGASILYDDQDETLWDRELIAKGAHYLHIASQGTKFSKYHLEAGIAFWHTIKDDRQDKWDAILQLYNQLLQMDYSPIAALNRTFALAKVHGNQLAILEAEKLQLVSNPYYHSLLGELYKETDSEKAINHFRKALSLAGTSADKEIIDRKILQLLANIHQGLNNN
jgi:RNA polymerase sigma-70 factor (ECF subfamily)